MSSKVAQFGKRSSKNLLLHSSVLVLVALLVGSLLVTAAMASGSLFNVTDYGAKGDGVTNDAPAIQQAIDAAAAAGGTVSIPSGTYLVNSTLNLRSGSSVVGTAGQTVLTMPAKSSTTFILSGTSLANVTLDGLTLRASAYTDNVSGVYLVGAKNSQARNLRFENLVYGLKLGSGPIGSGWVVDNIVARNTRTPLYASHITDSTFSNMDLEGAGTNTLDHAIYLNEQMQRVTFTNLTLTKGAGYALQLYISSGGTSSGLTFTNVTLDASNGRYPLVIGGGWSNVTFNGVTMKSARTDQADAKVYGISNLLMNGISASGGSALIEGSGDGVTLENGNYDGPRINASTITNLVVQNVTLGPAGTTTTTASTTTTTAPPATTTTLPPATTTTVGSTTTVPPATTTTLPLTTTTTTAPPTATTTPQVTTTTLPPVTTTTVPVTTTTTVLATNSTAQVVIVSPTDGSVIGDRAGVRATVTSPVPVAKVRFFSDSRLLANDYRAPYGFTWNTKGLTSGTSYNLIAVAYDSAGTPIGQSSARVMVVRLKSAEFV
ncbi:MAG: hypothetical protein M1337_03210, partial [Actinobacteria bacterium]|nr:hypothetical protein [Actinomycetota bacterium]